MVAGDVVLGGAEIDVKAELACQRLRPFQELRARLNKELTTEVAPPNLTILYNSNVDPTKLRRAPPA